MVYVFVQEDGCVDVYYYVFCVVYYEVVCIGDVWVVEQGVDCYGIGVVVCWCVELYVCEVGEFFGFVGLCYVECNVVCGQFVLVQFVDGVEV